MHKISARKFLVFRKIDFVTFSVFLTLQVYPNMYISNKKILNADFRNPIYVTELNMKTFIIIIIILAIDAIDYSIYIKLYYEKIEELSKGLNRFSNNLGRLFHLLLVDHQRRCESYHITMSILRQQAVFLQLQTHFPRVDFYDKRKMCSTKQ